MTFAFVPLATPTDDANRTGKEQNTTAGSSAQKGSYLFLLTVSVSPLPYLLSLGLFMCKISKLINQRCDYIFEVFFSQHLVTGPTEGLVKAGSTLASFPCNNFFLIGFTYS